ncbi:hypothetical protein QV12_20480 [Pseudomonas putida]|nr:hypothetical protein QV12_20480 [Pseudomonas putida]
MKKAARPEEQSSPRTIDSSSLAAVGPLIDAKELAERLGLTVRHVQRLASSGQLPHYRFGDLMRFSLADVLNATGRTAWREYGQ